MNVERIRDQLLEWTITGRTPDQAVTLLREAASAIDWLDAAGIHTCSDVCTRWACVMRRENASLKAERDQYKMGSQANANRWIEAWNECNELKAELAAEREACAKIVYGHCESDNAAQRIVDSIRARKP